MTEDRHAVLGTRHLRLLRLLLAVKVSLRLAETLNTAEAKRDTGVHRVDRLLGQNRASDLLGSRWETFDSLRQQLFDRPGH
jgi:hypothetical protein